jgi:hypothetical protein
LKVKAYFSPVPSLAKMEITTSSLWELCGLIVFDSLPFKTIDGIIEGNYRLAIQPEDAELPGVYMGNTTIGAEEGYTTEEGASITYTHAALIPEGDVVAKTVNSKNEEVYCAYRWRVITATKGTGEKYALTFKKPQDGETPPAEITETYAET